MNENLIPTPAEVQDKFETVSEAIVSFLQSNFGITLIDDWDLPITLDEEIDNVTTMIQNKTGEWIPYEPKTYKSKLRKR